MQLMSRWLARPEQEQLTFKEHTASANDHHNPYKSEHLIAVKQDQISH